MRVVTGAEFALQARERRAGFAAPAEVSAAVATIVADVRARGDAALAEYTARFDGVALTPESMVVPAEGLQAVYRLADEDFLRALRQAKERIEAFHRPQVPGGYRVAEPSGNVLGLAVRPLGRVGIYVPGGRASYPSSVLMNAIPARLAGVGEIVMCTPPGPAGRVDPAVLVAAAEAGVSRVFRVGGAQAIAAMAYGTATVPRVDKIVGPGNIYVTEAKRQVFGAVDIDGLHGPSEVAVVADGGADPDWVAADLIAQAEHDPLAVCVLITPSEALAARVREALAAQLEAAPRAAVAGPALAEHGLIVLARDLEEAVGLADALAPEHLQLMLAEPLPWLERVRNAGAVFLGYWTPVPAGDYAAGTNHVLPTGGSARFFSGLGVRDFVRTFDYFCSTAAGVADWGPASLALAEQEGLAGHGAAVERRLAAAGLRPMAGRAAAGEVSGELDVLARKEGETP